MKGKVALVTGGSSGIGRATALAFIGAAPSGRWRLLGIGAHDRCIDSAQMKRRDAIIDDLSVD